MVCVCYSQGTSPSRLLKMIYYCSQVGYRRKRNNLTRRTEFTRDGHQNRIRSYLSNVSINFHWSHMFLLLRSKMKNKIRQGQTVSNIPPRCLIRFLPFFHFFYFFTKNKILLFFLIDLFFLFWWSEASQNNKKKKVTKNIRSRRMIGLETSLDCNHTASNSGSYKVPPSCLLWDREIKTVFYLFFFLSLRQMSSLREAIR